MSTLKRKCLIIFEFISYILIIITYILYTVQSFLNQNFTNNKTKKIQIERALYENFSQEIYNNIQRKPIKKIKKDPVGEYFIEIYLNTY